MTEGHIPFEKLSAFYDEEFFLADEKENIIRHRHACIVCKTEYERLENTLSLCSSLKKYMICDGDFTSRTMKAIRTRRRNRILKRYIPAAVAASVVLAGGFALLPSLSSGSLMPAAVSVQADKTERIKELVNSGKGSILSVSDDCIECSVSSAAAEIFMRRMADENFRCERIHSSGYTENYGFSSLIHQVGTLSSAGSERYIPDSRVRFRIYR